MKDHIEAQLLAIKQRIAHEHSNGIDQTPEINQTLEKELLSLSDEELSQMEAKEDAYFQAVQEDLLFEQAEAELKASEDEFDQALLDELENLSDEELSQMEAKEEIYLQAIQDEFELDQISPNLESIDPSDYPKFYLNMINSTKELSEKLSKDLPADLPVKTHATPKFPVKSSMFTLAAIVLMLFFSTTGFQAPLVEEALTHHQINFPTDVSSDDPKEIVEILNEQLPFEIVLPTLKSNAKLLGARMTRITTGQDVMKDAIYLVYAVGRHKMSLLVYQDEHLDMNYQDVQTVKGKDYFFHQEKKQKETVVGFQGNGLIYLLTSTLAKEKIIQLF
jgi:hypothetical protein